MAFPQMDGPKMVLEWSYVVDIIANKGGKLLGAVVTLSSDYC